MSTTVSYLGPAGTFTEAAVLRFARRGTFGQVFGGAGRAEDAARGPITGEREPDRIDTLALASPGAVVDAVRAGSARAGVLAIENSVDGAVTQAFDALAQGGVQIFDELDLPIDFTIMTRPGSPATGTSAPRAGEDAVTAPESPDAAVCGTADPEAALREVATLASHPVGYQQVKGWLAKHAAHVQFVPASSNAAAARMVAEGQVDAAAAPDRAADLFQLQRVATGIADVRDARTRFVVVARHGRPPQRTGRDHTSVVFRLPNTPGSLVAALGEFAQRGVNLTRIASRPTREVFGTYLFFADMSGHIADAPVAEALRALWLRAEDIEFLGSWPNRSESNAGPAADGPDLVRIAQATEWVHALQEEGGAGWLAG